MKPPDPTVLAAKVFALVFAGLTLYCSAVYLVLRDVVGLQLVFGGLYRMFMYHAQHPFQYIALFCAVFAAGLASMLACWPRARQWPAWALTALVLLLTVLLGSALGGALWSLHDMQAGFFRRVIAFGRMLGGVWRAACRWAGWCCCSRFLLMCCVCQRFMGLAVMGYSSSRGSDTNNSLHSPRQAGSG